VAWAFLRKPGFFATLVFPCNFCSKLQLVLCWQLEDDRVYNVAFNCQLNDIRLLIFAWFTLVCYALAIDHFLLLPISDRVCECLWLAAKVYVVAVIDIMWPS